MCRHCDKDIDSEEFAEGWWVRFHQLIHPSYPICKYVQALEVLYQLIKYQCLGTDDPRLVTFDMQVLFIIIFYMIHEFYIQNLFWFLSGG